MSGNDATTRLSIWLWLILLALAVCGCMGDEGEDETRPQASPRAMADMSEDMDAGTKSAGGTAAEAAEPYTGVSDSAAEQDPVGEEQDPVVEEPDPVEDNSGELGERRGSTVRRPDDSIQVELRFLKASYNDAEDADLSILRFQFSTKQHRQKSQRAEVVLSSASEAASGMLDLGCCFVEIYPVVSKPRTTGRGSLGELGFEINGSYQVRVYLPDGELMGIFGLTEDADFRAAPPDLWPEGFGVRSRHQLSSYDPVRHGIYRKAEKGSKTVILATVSYLEAGFTTHQVSDPDNNIISYHFPDGRLEIWPPQDD